MIELHFLRWRSQADRELRQEVEVEIARDRGAKGESTTVTAADGEDDANDASTATACSNRRARHIKLRSVFYFHLLILTDGASFVYMFA